MLYEKWLNLELLWNEPQCMLFFWSSGYSRRACAFHPGSNKSDFVSVEYACGWVGMEAEMERQACSCDFWVCADLKWIWTAGFGMVLLALKWIWITGFGMVLLALKCVSFVLVCPVPQQRSRLTFSLKECSRFKSEALSTEFEACIVFYLKPFHDHGKPGNIAELFPGTDYQNFKSLLCRSSKIMDMLITSWHFYYK